MIARLKAERALCESEQRFRTLFEAAPDVIYVTDIEGTFVNVNKAAGQLSGIPRDQAIGRNRPALRKSSAQAESMKEVVS